MSLTGDFAVENKDGFFDWQLDTPGGSTTMEKVTEGTAKKPKFNITNLGNAWYSLQYMSSCNLKEGETYKITVNGEIRQRENPLRSGLKILPTTMR